MTSTSTSSTTAISHWTSFGEGPALVLLHGLGGDIGFWEADAAVLQESFRVVLIDLRGSGLTPASANGHTINDLADDVAAVLDQAGIEHTSVLGFSMGGLVAQAFAVRHPHRLERLVLASTFATMNAQARRFLDAVLDVYSTGASAKQMFDLICPWLFSIEFSANPAHAMYFEYPDDDPNEQPLHAWQKLYRAQQAFDGRSVLGTITAPTLVLVGDEDRLVSVDDARLLATTIPAAQLEILAGAGHLINIEAPSAFHNAVITFVLAASTESTLA